MLLMRGAVLGVPKHYWGFARQATEEDSNKRRDIRPKVPVTTFEVLAFGHNDEFVPEHLAVASETDRLPGVKAYAEVQHIGRGNVSIFEDYV